ncbi:MAG: hypothetical protein NTW86_06945 [Candidatus Sumerlaeota bacterium]|nr:hypothetical protein [Candidatus Sumerlaeota bacterium]
MLNPVEITKRKQLVVEGRDAYFFFQALLTHMGIDDAQIQDFGGISELGNFLRSFSFMPSFRREVQSVGIARDAESHTPSAFQSVQTALGKAGLPIPKSPNVAAQGDPRVSVFILPDCSRPGMLESLCLASVESDNAMECVEQFCGCLERMSGAALGNPAKARTHAFLASRPKPDLLLGQAAQAGYWPWDSLVFEPLKRFLRDL